MKTLDQIEPRTPISSAPFPISAPGAYYLTGNLTVSTGDAITISADGVTLDLNGFTISSTAAPAIGTGILLSGGRTNITILNGHISGGVTFYDPGVGGTYTSGPGFANGIYYSGTVAPVNAHVMNVSVSGCSLRGIYLGFGGTVESCMINTVGSYGIAADLVKNSEALVCGDTAISGTQVSDCSGQCTAAGGGIYAQNAQNCSGSTINGTGLNATWTAQNCTGRSGITGEGANGTGLSAYTAENCFGSSYSGGTGLSATTALNCRGEAYYFNAAGLSAQIAIGCYGLGAGTGFGISATIANSCIGSTVNAVNKYNMP
jgi:hypothetical protein